MSDMVLTGDANSLIDEVLKAASSLDKYNAATLEAVEATHKFDTATAATTRILKLMSGEEELAVITTKEFANQTDKASIRITGLSKDIKDLTSAMAQNTAETLANAEAAAERAASLAKTKSDKIYRSITEKYSNTLRDLPAEMQLSFRSSARAYADAMGEANKTVDDATKQMEKLRSGKVTNYSSERYAAASQQQDLGLKYLKQVENLEKSVAERSNQSVQERIRNANVLAQYYRQQADERAAQIKREDDATKAAANTQLQYAKRLQAQNDMNIKYKNLQDDITAGVYRHVRVQETLNMSTGELTKRFTGLTAEGRHLDATANIVNGRLAAFKGNISTVDDAAKQLTLSWRSLTRLLAVQLAHRAITELLYGLSQSVTTAKDLQIQIAGTQTISESGFNTAKWQEAILQVSNLSGTVASDVAAGLYETLSNQVADGGKAVEFMTEASRLAIATNSTLKDSINALSSVLNAYNEDVGQAGHISDVFFRSIDIGRMVMPNFANALGKILPAANELGVSLEEVMAFLSTATIQGVTEANAITYLGAAFNRLLKPAGAFKDLLAELNVTSARSAVATYGFAGLLNKINEMARGEPDLIAQLFPDQRAMRGLFLTTGKQIDRYNDSLKRTREAVGAVDSALEKFNQNAGKQFEIEINKITNMLTLDFGTAVINNLKYLNDFVKLSDIFKTTVGTSIAVGSALFVSSFSAMYEAIRKSTIALDLYNKARLIAFAPITAVAAAAVGAELAIFYALDREQKRRLELARGTIDIFNTMDKKLEESVAKTTSGIKEIAEEYRKTGLLAIANFGKKTVDELEKTDAEAKAAAETFKRLNNEFASYLNKLASDTTSKIQKLQTEIVKAGESTRKMRQGLTDSLISDFVDGQTNIKRQQAAMLDAITYYIDAMNKATTQADISDNGRQALDYAKQLMKIQTKWDNDRSKNQQLVIKLTKEQYTLMNKYYKVDKDKRNKRRQELLQQIGDKLLTNNQKLQDLSLETPGQIDTMKLASDILRGQEAAVDRLNKKNQKRIDAEKAVAEVYAEQKRKIESVQSYLEKVDFDKLIKADDKTYAKDSTGVLKAIDTYEEMVNKFTEVGSSERKTYENNIKEYIKTFNKAVSDRMALITRNKLVEDIQEFEKAQDTLAKRNAEDLKPANAEVALATLQLRNEMQQYLRSIGYLFNATSTREMDALVTKAGTGDIGSLNTISSGLLELQKFQYNFEPKLVSSFDTLKLALANRDKVEQTAKTANDNLAAEIKAATAKLQALDPTLTATQSNTTALEQNTKAMTETLSVRLSELTTRIAALNIQPPAPNVSGYASGGFIRSGTDTVPAMLTPGEFVVNAKSTRRFYRQLQAINSGGSTTSVGDISINYTSTGSTESDIVALGKALRRGIRRGRINLG